MFDLADEPLDLVGRVDLGAVVLGEAHVVEDVDFGLVEESGGLVPLGLGGFGVVLGEGGGDEGRNYA